MVNTTVSFPLDGGKRGSERSTSFSTRVTQYQGPGSKPCFPVAFLTGYPQKWQLSHSLGPRSSIEHYEMSSRGRNWRCGIPIPWLSGSTSPPPRLRRTTRKVLPPGGLQSRVGGCEFRPSPPFPCSRIPRSPQTWRTFLLICVKLNSRSWCRPRGDVITSL